MDGYTVLAGWPSAKCMYIFIKYNIARYCNTFNNISQPGYEACVISSTSRCLILSVETQQPSGPFYLVSNVYTRAPSPHRVRTIGGIKTADQEKS